MRKPPTPAPAPDKRLTSADRMLRAGRLPDGTPLTREALAAMGALGTLSHTPCSVSSARRRGTALFVAVEALAPPAVLAVAGVLLLMALIFDRDSLAALAL